MIEGDVAVLPCNAFGDPLPTVTWRSSGSSDRLNPGGRYFLRRDNSLEIHQTEQEDAGMYVCHAENPAGSYSMDVSLDVLGECVTCLKKVTPKQIGSHSYSWADRGTDGVLTCCLAAWLAD